MNELNFTVERKHKNKASAVVVCQKENEHFSNKMNFCLFIFFPQGTPMLVIGHHLLHGKVVDLDKPYAVLHKEVNIYQNDGSRKGDTCYNICALVNKKIIFKTRPKPIVFKNMPITR